MQAAAAGAADYRFFPKCEFAMSAVMVMRANARNAIFVRF
jgi:hypothetical protein